MEELVTLGYRFNCWLSHAAGNKPGLETEHEGYIGSPDCPVCDEVEHRTGPKPTAGLMNPSATTIMGLGPRAPYKGDAHRYMYLDLHCHSVSSDDSRATVEQYVKWIQVLRKRGYVADGIVLTEHRKFDFDKDYSQLGEEYGVLVLKGSELDTRYGHFLVYGVTEALTRELDFSDVAMDARELLQAARQHDALAVPAHPGRYGIGLVDYMEQGEVFEDLHIVERLNGGSRPGENERAEELCQRKGYLGTGGSDAHLASHISSCLTEFSAPVRNERELVDALLSGEFRPVRLEATRKGAD